MLKKIIKYTLSQISFFFSILSCLKIFFEIRRRNIDVFLSPEGGFGPSISKAIMLRCLYRDENNFILIFGYNPGRHNPLVSNLFINNFKWLNLTSKIVPFSLVLEKNKYLIFKILYYLLSKYSNIKKINYINDYLCELWNIKSLPQEKENNYGSYRKIHKFIFQNEKYITYDEKILKNILNKLNLKLNSKKCTIFLRDKGKNSNDIAAKLRDSDVLENYRTAIELNIKKGWQFFLSGDEVQIPDWVKKYSTEIIFRKKTNLKIDEYNILTGLESDCFIASGSGPVSWKLLSPKKPFLVIDGYPIGFGWYKSTVAFKIIKNKYFNTIEELFSDRGLQINPPIECDFLNEEEKSKVITEFLDDYSFGKVSGLDWKELNLDENSLLSSGYAKASKEWFKIQKFKI